MMICYMIPPAISGAEGTGSESPVRAASKLAVCRDWDGLRSVAAAAFKTPFDRVFGMTSAERGRVRLRALADPADRFLGDQVLAEGA